MSQANGGPVAASVASAQDLLRITQAFDFVARAPPALNSVSDSVSATLRASLVLQSSAGQSRVGGRWNSLASVLGHRCCPVQTEVLAQKSRKNP